MTRQGFELRNVPLLSRVGADRADALRTDVDAAVAGWPDALLLRVDRRNQVLISGGQVVLGNAAKLGVKPPENAVFLGRLADGRHVWAIRAALEGPDDPHTETEVLDLRRAGQIFDSWTFTGYGSVESSTMGLKGTSALKAATGLAMRDAAAKLAAEFREQAIVRGLLPSDAPLTPALPPGGSAAPAGATAPPPPAEGQPTAPQPAPAGQPPAQGEPQDSPAGESPPAGGQESTPSAAPPSTAPAEKSTPLAEGERATA